MGRMRKLLIPGVDKKLLVKDAAKLLPDPARRRFIAGGASLGALTLLTGCDVFDSSSAERLLISVSKFNDAVQAFIFNPYAMAPEYPESAITKPFPFNAYYELDDAPEVDGKDWKFEVRGLVENKKSWTLDPQTQMTFKFADEVLPRAYGYPMKIRVPTKLGFKSPKYVISMEVTNDYKGGYWEDQGYNSFSGS
jgi:DMSO/TMAO reductase YedYZ molybdopterin-dependent catalytic subunit